MPTHMDPLVDELLLGVGDGDDALHTVDIDRLLVEDMGEPLALRVVGGRNESGTEKAESGRSRES